MSSPNDNNALTLASSFRGEDPSTFAARDKRQTNDMTNAMSAMTTAFCTITPFVEEMKKVAGEQV